MHFFYNMLFYLIVRLSAGRDSYNFKPSSVSGGSSRSTSRLTLAPWSSQHRQERGQNSVTNANQHFRFTQNLRQGLPVSCETSTTNNRQAENILDQLATNMILQKPMIQPSPEHSGIFRGLRDSRVNELQPQMQQVTPPFNLSKWFTLYYLSCTYRDI
jgi:hypothetical protein